MGSMSVVQGYAAPVVPKRNLVTPRRRFQPVAEQEHWRRAYFPASAMRGIILGCLIGGGIYLLLGLAVYAAIH